MLNLILNIVLGALCMLLLKINFNKNRHLKKICSVLRQIEKGNFNQRIRIITSQRLLLELGENLNGVINSFRHTFEREQYLEEQRKKLISNISHDLRTPLTSLLGYIEALEKDINLSQEERTNYLSIVHNKANNLYLLLEEFFEFSKLEAEDIVMKFEKINITSKIQDVSVGFFQDFINEGIEPQIKLPDEDVYILGDSKSIDRILTNLISNALRYGKEGKVIGIELREEKDLIRVDIWNGGKGIPQKDLPYIFERLYTAEKSRNKKLQGSGLGLAIVKQLVEKQNGTISVSSLPDVKTTFSFSLPKAL